MTIEQLQAKKQDLEKQKGLAIADMHAVEEMKVKAIATVQAISGAIQAVDQLISEEVASIAAKPGEPAAIPAPDPVIPAPQEGEKEIPNGSD